MPGCARDEAPALWLVCSLIVSTARASRDRRANLCCLGGHSPRADLSFSPNRNPVVTAAGKDVSEEPVVVAIGSAPDRSTVSVRWASHDLLGTDRNEAIVGSQSYNGTAIGAVGQHGVFFSSSPWMDSK